jgi:trimeric autotransporter adhesin
MSERMSRSVVLFVLVAAPSHASAQCEPTWDTAPGTPGITDGYVQPVAAFTDPAGPAIYAGGSFEHIGGQLIKFVSRYDPVAETWSKLGSGINNGNVNGFVTSLITYNPGDGERLIVGGFFKSAGGVGDTQSIAMWDGAAWDSLGALLFTDPLVPDSIWDMAVTDAFGASLLYVGGQFKTIGGQEAYGIAFWDGERWIGMGTAPMGGFSPGVFELDVFDDGSGPAIWAGGRFSSISGVSSPLIARWDGQNWSRPGNGLIANSQFADVAAMAVFDDGSGPALYVGGSDFRPSGGPTCSVAKWDGTAWTAVGQNLGGRVWDLAVFDDGSGPALFSGGTAQPDIKYLAKLVNGQWVTYRGGIEVPEGPPWPSIFGMAAIGDSLWIGGNYEEIDGQTASGIARLVACGGDCYPDFNGDEQLDLFDFLEFVNEVNALTDRADCTEDGGHDLFDFLCFVNAFNEGC